MRSRSAYTRRIRANARFQKCLAAVLLVSVAVGGIVSLAIYPERNAPRLRFSRDSSEVALIPVDRTVSGSSSRQSVTPRARKFYPYSVVPGGVYDHAEVARIVATDTLVASHYSDINLAKIRSIEVVRPRGVYVSYRKGDRIFWTSKRLMLVPGELVLTDGSSEIRARCGNRISEVPRTPVDASEPNGVVFDASYEPIAAGGENGEVMIAAYEGDFDFMRTSNGQAHAFESFAFNDDLIRAHSAAMPAGSRFVAGPLAIDSGRFGTQVITIPGLPPARIPDGGLTDSPNASSPGPDASGLTPPTPRDDVPLAPVKPADRPATPTERPAMTPGEPVTTPTSSPRIPPSKIDPLRPAPPMPAEARPVPEPSGLWLAAIGLAAMAAIHTRRRRRRSSTRLF
jgi:hypothetical protein